MLALGASHVVRPNAHRRGDTEHRPSVKSLFALLVASLLLAGAAVAFGRRRSSARALLVLACVSFVVVALTHVFEAFAILPGAGWGQPRSIGHYTDLTAALLGSLFVVAALVARMFRRPPS
jgi:hypothetical protein